MDTLVAVRNILTLTSQNNKHVLNVERRKTVDNTSFYITVKTKDNIGFISRLNHAFKYVFKIKSINNDNTFKIDASINKYLLELITTMQTDHSNLVKHAMDEFKLIGYDKDRMGNLMSKQVIELLAIFSMHGHSGNSAPFAINLFKKLANFETISGLTFKDEEWHKVDETLYQNIRASHIFKEGDNIRDINAFYKSVTSSKYFIKEKLVKIKRQTYSGGRIFESKSGIATGRVFRRVFIKEEDKAKLYYPKKPIGIPTIQIEVQPEDWLMFVDHKSSALRDLGKAYNINWEINEDIKGLEIIKIDHSNF